MNIKILDSWLREYLQTNATPERIAKEISLTSVSIEHLKKYKQDLTYDIEITTNRPDLASVNGLAREAGAVLPQQGVQATYIPLKTKNHEYNGEANTKLIIENDPSLVNRICAVILEIKQKSSPEVIKDRLEASDIRSLNNIVDITNYVMRVTGQPTHVFDYDRVGTYIKIRPAKKGEKITTLDHKPYTLSGGDIVAENKNGEIIDLLGIMGLENTVVTQKTKRIVFFINNVDSDIVRKTSMEHGIRTEAVQLNEKHLDPELCMTALRYGIQLYKEHADATQLNDIIDIYPHPLSPIAITVDEEKINRVIGVSIPIQKSAEILEKLGFTVTIHTKTLQVVVPTFRSYDVSLPEDIIEEIARVYGYHNLPNELPTIHSSSITQMENNPFYWEQRVKTALKYWGFSETYTYSMVSESQYEGPIEDAVIIANPLNEEMVYMRKTIVPSLLQVINENKTRESVQLFEIANIYQKRNNDLPNETQTLAGIVKKPHVSFFTVKGYIEQLFHDLGIQDYSFLPLEGEGEGAKILIANKTVGDIEILDENLIDFELNFAMLIANATNKKKYSVINKFPPIYEDISLHISQTILTSEITNEIKKQSSLIQNVSLVDRYENSRTFHVIYQDATKNLTSEEVKDIHQRILTSLHKKWKVTEKI